MGTQLGTQARELWRLRRAAAVCLTVAAVCGASAFYQLSLLPPGAEPRRLEIASASTQVLVDTPRSAILDLDEDTYSFQAMTNRAVLLGNIMVSAPVLARVARRARVPAHEIRASTPLTPEFPRPFTEVGQEQHTSDLLRSADQHRISVRANPTVPVLTVVTQAPDAVAAERLANAAVDGLRDHLAAIAIRQRIAPGRRVTLEQLGRARGAVVNGGQPAQAALVLFVAGFGLTAVALRGLRRLGRGRREARPQEPPPEPPPPEPPRPEREPAEDDRLALR